MPREALRTGAKLVIINQGEIPFDQLAHLRFHERIGDVLPKAVRRFKDSWAFLNDTLSISESFEANNLYAIIAHIG